MSLSIPMKFSGGVQFTGSINSDGDVEMAVLGVEAHGDVEQLLELFLAILREEMDQAEAEVEAP